MPAIEISNGFPQTLKQSTYRLVFADVQNADDVLLELSGKTLPIRLGNSDPAYSSFMETDPSALSAVLFDLDGAPDTINELVFQIKPYRNGSQSWILYGLENEEEIWVNRGAKVFSGIVTSVLRFARSSNGWTIEAMEDSRGADRAIQPEPVVQNVETSQVLATPLVEGSSLPVSPETQAEIGQPSESVSPQISTPQAAPSNPVAQSNSSFGFPEHLLEEGQKARALGTAGSAQNFEIIFDISASMHDNLQEPATLLPVVSAIQALAASVSAKPIRLSMGAQSFQVLSSSDDVLPLLEEACHRALGIEMQTSDALDDLLEEHLEKVGPGSAVFILSDAFPYLDIDELLPILEKGNKQLRILLLAEPRGGTAIGNNPKLQWQVVDLEQASIMQQIRPLI